MNDILSLSAAELGAKLKARELSPVDAVEACLERIETTEPKLNAYVRVLAEEARAAALAAWEELHQRRPDHREEAKHPSPRVAVHANTPCSFAPLAEG